MSNEKCTNPSCQQEYFISVTGAGIVGEERKPIICPYCERGAYKWNVIFS